MDNMFKKIYRKVRWISSIRVFDYIYLNYFCKKIVRDKDVFIVPYKGAILDLHRKSKLILKGKDLEIGINKIGRSKAETYVRLMEGAVWNCSNGGAACYNATIEVHRHAVLDTGYFFMNTGSVLIAEKHISMGDDVWIGRNNVIYDSDFHTILNEDNKAKNLPENVVIGDHVWLTNHVVVQKGVNIEKGSVIGGFTIVRKDVPEKSLVVNGTKQVCVASDIRWSSKKP